MKRAILSIIVVAWTGSARAQAPSAATPDAGIPDAEPPGPAPTTVPVPAPAPIPVTAPTPPPIIEVPLLPSKIDNAAACVSIDTTPGALMEVIPKTGQLGTPIPWTEFAIEGSLIDPSATVHGLLEPTLNKYRTSLSADKWPDIAAVTAKFGYQLIGHVIAPGTTRLVLHLAPLPMIRTVAVSIPQGLFDRLLDAEVGRRMRLRTGTYLPWETIRRKCAETEEQVRIEEFLHDEGYADATVKITESIDNGRVKLKVKVDLGVEYRIGKITIKVPPGESLAIPKAEIDAKFHHTQTCLIGLCFGTLRFTRTQHQEDLQTVRRLFHKRGYPGARVQSDFDPAISFDRHSLRVNITLSIDQRRHLDILFEGNDRDSVSDDQLREQLTFDAAGSADDVEAALSARALANYLQTRGFFDAHVTWTRTRFSDFDRIAFQIDQGRTREVQSVQFAGNTAITTDTLKGIVATKAAGLKGSLLGTNTAATSAQLAADVDRIVEAYRRTGYRDTRVHVAASTEEPGLRDAALTAALVGADRGGDLYVRYEIEEGRPTLMTSVEFVGDAGIPIDPRLCDQLLGELATELTAPGLAHRHDKTKCVVDANLKFREDDVVATRDRLRDYLFKTGRPRAVVELATVPIGPNRVAARYTLGKIDQLKVGKVVLRGNVRTKDWVIFGQLKLHEGDLLTTDDLADSARLLRNTGLFNAVNIDMPDLDNASQTVNAVVRVEERYDYTAQIDVEFGYSSVNELFGTLAFHQNNIGGYGISWTNSVTEGQKITDLESSLRFPRWLMHPWSPIELQTDITGLYQQLDTPQFGELTTEGFTVAFSRTWPRVRSATEQARVISFTPLRYDFRLRSRNVDALRAIGADVDDTQVAISTRTGALGVAFEWEQRVDRRGQLAPLSPEDGYHLLATFSVASPVFYGQDTFIKVSASGSRFIPIGKNLVLRADLRYDQGIPLGGAVLLPDVERFFAGGDNTVRGYNDDALATEIVQVGVPPVGNISQIRVIPAGGNIRVMSSLDAQVRIWKILAGAVFTDAGMITNQWSTVTENDIRPSVGMGLRALTPFGIAALEYAVPINPQLGDDPRGRIHFYFAARAQF